MRDRRIAVPSAGGRRPPRRIPGAGSARPVPASAQPRAAPGARVVLALVLVAGAAGCSAQGPQVHQAAQPDQRPGIEYWDRQRQGANCFNDALAREWFEAASQAGIRLVRLAYGKWKSERRDFLLGSADQYEGLVAADLAELVRVLDFADEEGIKVVIVPLSLPGARFRQFNGGERDARLWTDPSYLSQATTFWRDLALHLKDHPAVAAYDLLNEPHPEWFHGKRGFWDSGFDRWYDSVQGGPGDLNRFYRAVVEAIRGVDPRTPLVVESGLYATPWAFDYLQPLEDERVLYSFHMYEPYVYTTRRINAGRFSYPGPIPVGDSGEERVFDAEAIDEFFEPVRQWSERHGIPSSRIFAAEFGCDRTTAGAAEYLADLLRVFNREGWHWAFYSFREDSWESMDYELGTGKPGGTYWAASEQGTLVRDYPRIYGPRADNPLWRVFRAEFEAAAVRDVGEER